MVSRQASRGEVVVTAPVEVDIATAPQLTAELAQACALRPARVVVDCTTNTFCDTAALDVLLDAGTSLRREGCVLEIRSPHTTLCRIAALLGLSDELGLPT